MLLLAGLTKACSSQSLLWGRVGPWEPPDGVCVEISSDLKVREESLKKVSSCLHLVLSWPVTKMSASARPKSSPWICWTVPYPPKSGLSRVFFPEGKKKLSIALQTSLPLVHTPASSGKADGLIWSFRHPWRAELIADSWWTYDNQVSFRPLKLAWGCLRGNCLWGVGSTQRWWRQREPWLKPLRIGCNPHWGWRGASSDSVLVAGARVWVDFMEHPSEGWL